MEFSSNANLCLLALLSILFILLFHWKYTQTNQPSKEPQLSLPPKFTYFVDLVRGKFDLSAFGPIKLISTGYQRHGEIFRIRVLHKHITFLIGGEASSVLFSPNDSQVSAKEVYGFTIPVFGKGIVYDASTEVMAQQTKWILNGLSSSYLEVYCSKIAIEAYDYFSQFPQECTKEVHSLMLELVCYTASRCLLGDEIRQSLGPDIGEMLMDLSDGISHMSIIFPKAPTERHRKRDSAHKAIVDLVVEIVRKRRKEGVKRQDYLQYLMDSVYRDGTRLSEENIGGLILATLFGGQHTSSNALTWLTMSVARSGKTNYINFSLKDKWTFETKLLDEQIALFKHDASLGTKKLDKLQLLHNCLKEVLRMFPPLIVLARGVLKTLLYKDFYIPKGDIIAVSPAITHRLPGVYKDPDVFDPERFGFGRDEGSGRYEYQPFGGGRHKCLGRNFAFIQIKTIFSVMLQMFELRIVDHGWKPVVNYSGIIAGPFDNNLVQFKRRGKSDFHLDIVKLKRDLEIGNE